MWVSRGRSAPTMWNSKRGGGRGSERRRIYEREKEIRWFWSFKKESDPNIQNSKKMI